MSKTIQYRVYLTYKTGSLNIQTSGKLRLIRNMYNISRMMAKHLSILVGFLILQAFDREMHHIDDKTEIVLLTEEPLPLTINR